MTLTSSRPEWPGTRQCAFVGDVTERAGAVLVCVLGRFRVLKAGQPLEIKSGAKPETLLTILALRRESGATRETLLASLWPDGDPTLAAESLNSLTYRLHRALGDALLGSPPVVYTGDGRYRLNVEAGVDVDSCCFDGLAGLGREYARAGNSVAAMQAYEQAVGLYRGDLNAGSDVYAAIERERLRDLYSALLSELAEDDYARGNHSSCLERTFALLAHDPVREDAHRLAMRCLAHLGQRGRALRQYRVCESILRAEFAAVPEPATVALFDQLRLAPDSL